MPAQIGNGFSLDAARQDRFQLAPAQAIFAGLAQISFSGWARPRAGADDEARNLIAIGNDARFGPGGHPSFDITYDGGQLKIRCLPNEAADGGPYVTETSTSTAPELEVGAWVHLGVEIDIAAKVTRLYENGVLAESFENIGYAEAAFDAQHVSQDSAFGANSSAGAWFAHADIDEYRLQKVKRSAGWFQAEYASMATPGFVTLGPAQAR